MNTIRITTLLALLSTVALAQSLTVYRQEFDDGFYNGFDGWTIEDRNPLNGLVTWDDDYDADARASAIRALHCADRRDGSASGTAQHYENEMNAVVERSFDLRFYRAGDRIRVRFRIWRDLEPGYDYFRIKVSTDGGATYRTIDSSTGSFRYWTTLTYDISQYAGMADVRIALVVETDWIVVREGVYIDDFEILVDYPVASIDDLWPGESIYSEVDRTFGGRQWMTLNIRLTNRSAHFYDIRVRVRLKRWRADGTFEDLTGWYSANPARVRAGETVVAGYCEAFEGAGVYSWDVRLETSDGGYLDHHTSYEEEVRGHRDPTRYYRTYGIDDPHPDDDFLADDLLHHPSHEEILWVAGTAIQDGERHDPVAGRLRLMRLANSMIRYQSDETGICTRHDRCTPGDETTDLDNLALRHRDSDGKILGDCNDYGTLYIGMARAMGLPSRRLTIIFFSGRGWSDIEGYGDGWSENGGHAAAETYDPSRPDDERWVSVDPTWNFVDAPLRWLNSNYADNGHVSTSAQRNKEALFDTNQVWTWLGDVDPSTEDWADRVLRYNPEPPPGVTRNANEDPDACRKPATRGYYFNVPRN